MSDDEEAAFDEKLDEAMSELCEVSDDSDQASRTAPRNWSHRWEAWRKDVVETDQIYIQVEGRTLTVVLEDNTLNYLVWNLT